MTAGVKSTFALGGSIPDGWTGQTHGPTLSARAWDHMEQGAQGDSESCGTTATSCSAGSTGQRYPVPRPTGPRG